MPVELISSKVPIIYHCNNMQCTSGEDFFFLSIMENKKTRSKTTPFFEKKERSNPKGASASNGSFHFCSLWEAQSDRIRLSRSQLLQFHTRPTRCLYLPTRSPTRPDSRRLHSGIHPRRVAASRPTPHPHHTSREPLCPIIFAHSNPSSVAQTSRELDRSRTEEGKKKNPKQLAVVAMAVEVCVKAAVGHPDTLGDCEFPVPVGSALCPAPHSDDALNLSSFAADPCLVGTALPQVPSPRGCCSRWRRRRSPTRWSSSTSATSPTGPPCFPRLPLHWIWRVWWVTAGWQSATLSASRLE